MPRLSLNALRSQDMNEALFYERYDGNAVKCILCPHACIIPQSKTGRCRVRRNIDGSLYSEIFGKVSSISLDPIEKKPLCMFHPGSRILSVGSFGCNLTCPFCQNSDISINFGDDLEKAGYLNPEQVVFYAQGTVSDNNIGVAYTYNEPLIGYEFVLESSRLIHQAGLLNVVVTNGYINKEPLEKLLPYIDAMNIDLKSYNEEFYKKLGGSLPPVIKTIETAYTWCHIEITTLVILEENDSEDESKKLAERIASISDKIPLHLSRFFPRYRYANKKPTSRETIIKLKEVANRHLEYVFTGNM